MRRESPGSGCAGKTFVARLLTIARPSSLMGSVAAAATTTTQVGGAHPASDGIRMNQDVSAGSAASQTMAATAADRAALTTTCDTR